MSERTILTYYIFDHIPGTHPAWRVAILATSLDDARNWVRVSWGSGRYVERVTSGYVGADCGDVTPKAQQVLRQRMEDNQ